MSCFGSCDSCLLRTWWRQRIGRIQRAKSCGKLVTKRFGRWPPSMSQILCPELSEPSTHSSQAYFAEYLFSLNCCPRPGFLNSEFVVSPHCQPRDTECRAREVAVHAAEHARSRTRWQRNETSGSNAKHDPSKKRRTTGRNNAVTECLLPHTADVQSRYVLMHVYVYMYIFTYIHIHILTFCLSLRSVFLAGSGLSVPMHACMHIQMVCLPMYAYANILVAACAYMCVRVRTNVRCEYTQTCMFARAYIRYAISVPDRSLSRGP